MKKSLCVILASTFLSFSALAQNVEKVDSVTGVNYEVDENGEFARLRATGEAELEFGDRRDIRTATQKAQMRAKANIAKFLNERVSSEEVTSSLEKSMTNTSGKSKEAIRETIDTYTESIHNSAEALLKGVIATKTDVNKDEKYVQVEVGLSPKTMKAADTLNKGLKEDNSDSLGNSSTGTIDSGNGREIKKVKNYDSF